VFVTREKLRKRKVRPSRSVAARVLVGTSGGATLGLHVAIACAAALIVNEPPGPWRHGVVRLMPVGLAAGAVAGAWMAWMQPRMRSRSGAAAVGLATVAIFLAVAAMLGASWELAPPFLMAAPFAGVALGLVVREVSPDVLSEEERAVDALDSPAVRLTAWLARVAEQTEAAHRDMARASGADVEALPESWRAVLTANVPLYSALDDAARARLHRHTHDFLRRVHFEGAAGMEITPEVRVTIAAQACMLLLGIDRTPYPDVRSVVVYPQAYDVPADARPRWGVLNTEPGARLGESWGHGTVVLSWADVLRGAADPADGENLVFHEFAHQFDQETGAADGVPSLVTVGARGAWTALLHRELAALRDELDRGGADVLDDYAAKNEAEFFAVSTETFFERPHDLRRAHPELYEAMRTLFGIDPATLHAAA
jgi:Mlc titration factor MtfA (ptsG expression regulator)